MINIDTILKSKGLTKNEVAARMGLVRESLYRILNGNPTLENIEKLAVALEMPVYELFFINKPNNIIGTVRVGAVTYEINSLSDLETLVENIKSNL